MALEGLDAPKSKRQMSPWYGKAHRKTAARIVARCITKRRSMKLADGFAKEGSVTTVSSDVPTLPVPDV
jgi:hypothetical protein